MRRRRKTKKKWKKADSPPAQQIESNLVHKSVCTNSGRWQRRLNARQLRNGNVYSTFRIEVSHAESVFFFLLLFHFSCVSISIFAFMNFILAQHHITRDPSPGASARLFNFAASVRQDESIDLYWRIAHSVSITYFAEMNLFLFCWLSLEVKRERVLELVK